MRLIDADKIKYDDIPIANARGIVVTRKAVMQRTIEDMPTIERPKGKWKYNKIEDIFICSVCSSGTRSKDSFCSNCGAEMGVAKIATTTEEVEE